LEVRGEEGHSFPHHGVKGSQLFRRKRPSSCALEKGDLEKKKSSDSLGTTIPAPWQLQGKNPDHTPPSRKESGMKKVPISKRRPCQGGKTSTMLGTRRRAFMIMYKERRAAYLAAAEKKEDPTFFCVTDREGELRGKRGNASRSNRKKDSVLDAQKEGGGLSCKKPRLLEKRGGAECGVSISKGGIIHLHGRKSTWK